MTFNNDNSLRMGAGDLSTRGVSQPETLKNKEYTPQEENYFIRGANLITQSADNVANRFENVPLFGGIMAAEKRLEGEVAALPLKAAGTGGKIAGSIIQFNGQSVEYTHKLAGKALDKVGDAHDKAAEVITDTADTVAQVQEKIPVIGGLMGASTRLSGEVLALPGKAYGMAFDAAGKAVELPGKIIGGVSDAVGGVIKKL